MSSIFLGITALGGGIIVSAGLFAVLVTIRLVNRFAHISGTKKYLYLYETMIIVGAIVANTCLVFDIRPFDSRVLGSIYGLIAGMYSGAFFVSIAEVIKGIPIFIRRVRISDGLGWILLSLAVGKTIGSLLDGFLF